MEIIKSLIIIKKFTLDKNLISMYLCSLNLFCVRKKINKIQLQYLVDAIFIIYEM